MASDGAPEVTELLKAWGNGDAAALDRLTRKRGAGVHAASMDLDQVAEVSGHGRELIAADDALTALAQVDPRKARVIELRFFGGLSVEETAEVLTISPQSVMRDWKLAKAWLLRELSRGDF
jgi:RNA polymerase sigma-70 factor, ECF subfamily